ncbi:MAG: SusC/RagA family TonB-linked outer membrane protein, partial [Candidatus Dadabacteria bacterium]
MYIKSLKNLLLIASVVCCTPMLRAQDIAKTNQQNNRLSKFVSVSGTIKEAATGKPIRGARITYKEFSAAISDSTGRFSLKVPTTTVSVLVESEGYQTKEVALKGQTEVSASLYEDTFTSYYDVVTQPFGQPLKSHSPYAVTSVQTNGAWDRVNETPSTYLQGKVAGLNVIRRSGTPNSGATLSLRGITSLYATNQPLIIVDGMIFDNTDYGGSIIANHYTDPLSTIDVRDIDNISVLKDGSSIYGTKGANGVIIITTARARELGTKIDFSAFTGINLAPERIPVLDAAGYRIYLSDVLKSQGLSSTDIAALPFMKDDRSNSEYFSYHNNTDWQKLALKQSLTRNVYLKVTGGDNIAKYGLSLGYLNTDGITSQTGLNRYNMRFNGDLNLSKRMTATTNLSFTFNEQNLRDQGTAVKTNPVYLSLVKSPLLRAHEVSDIGAESPLLSDVDIFNIGNPIVLTNTALGVNKNYRFLGSIGFNYQLNDAFALASTVGVTNDKVRENFFIPRKGISSDTLATDIAYSRLGSHVKSLFSLFNDTRVGYSKRFNVHELSAHLGMRYLFSRSERDFGLGYNSAIDELVSVGNGVNALRRIGGSFGETKWLNNYFNADYSYSDKYFVSFNVALDGSSRFGNNIPGALTISGNKYAVLPSVAAAWLVSSENFLKGSFVELLKLRASYGLSGNDDIGNYSARQTYVSQNLLGVEGLVRSGFGNDQLQWEQMTKANVGADVSILKERLSFSVDAYNNKVDNMVAYEKAPVASGFSYAISNSAALSTKGVEATLNGRILNKTTLKWDVGFTISKYKSQIDKLPNSPSINSFAGATYITQVGATPNLFYGYQTDGVYSSDAEAAQAGLSIRKADVTITPFTGGDVRFRDVNGDKIIDANDRQVIGNPNPDYFGSATTKIGYRNFSVDVLFTFSKGNDVYNWTRNQLENMSGYENQTEAVLSRWRTNSQVTTIPKATFGDPMGNSRFSDRWIEDGSYMRLRTLSLSYNIP